MTKPLNTTEVVAQVVQQVAKEVARATLVAASAQRAAPAAVSTPQTPARRRPSPTMATLTAEQRELMQTCVHEASHAVAGVVLGAPMFVAAALGGGHGKTVWDELPPGTDTLITYAGPYGEAKFNAGGLRPAQRQVFAAFDGHGRQDRNVLTAAGDGHQTGRDVVPLIERTWPAIIRVAQQLHRAGEVTEKDVLAALGVTDGGTRTSVQLASIRSGCRSVPPITRKTPAPA